LVGVLVVVEPVFPAVPVVVEEPLLAGVVVEPVFPGVPVVVEEPLLAGVFVEPAAAATAVDLVPLITSKPKTKAAVMATRPAGEMRVAFIDIPVNDLVFIFVPSLGLSLLKARSLGVIFGRSNIMPAYQNRGDLVNRRCVILAAKV
jgi:hypothetical protein